MPIDEKTLVYVDDAIDEEFLKKFFVYLYSLVERMGFDADELSSHPRKHFRTLEFTVG